jgi:mercuric ion binding protein
MKLTQTLSIAAMLLLSFTVHAQTDTVRIKTSAICDQCKDRIEHDLSFEKGVKSVHLDLPTKIITVIFNEKKTNEQNIREAISKIGYDADSLKADLRSYNKLPECCKHSDQPH